MKTTIEVNGYEIVIEETESGEVSVSAVKDGETVEEFTLEGGDGHDFEGEEEDDFDDFEDEKDEINHEQDELEEEEDELEDEEDELEEEEDELEEEHEEHEHEDHEETKLESFNAFIRRRK